MNISSTVNNRLQQRPPITQKPLQPETESELNEVDNFVRSQSRDNESGIALVILGAIAAPVVIGAVASGVLASNGLNAGAVGTSVAAITGGVVGLGLMLSYF